MKQFTKNKSVIKNELVSNFKKLQGLPVNISHLLENLTIVSVDQTAAEDALVHNHSLVQYQHIKVSHPDFKFYAVRYNVDRLGSFVGYISTFSQLGREHFIEIDIDMGGDCFYKLSRL